MSLPHHQPIKQPTRQQHQGPSQPHHKPAHLQHWPQLQSRSSAPAPGLQSTICCHTAWQGRPPQQWSAWPVQPAPPEEEGRGGKQDRTEHGRKVQGGAGRGGAGGRDRQTSTCSRWNTGGFGAGLQWSELSRTSTRGPAAVRRCDGWGTWGVSLGTCALVSSVTTFDQLLSVHHLLEDVTSSAVDSMHRPGAENSSMQAPRMQAGRCHRQAERQTDRGHHPLSPLPLEMEQLGGGMLTCHRCQVTHRSM